MRKKNIKDFVISKNSTFLNAIKLLNISANKCLCVVNEKKKFIGTLSDGDLRKAILKNNDLKQTVDSIYNKSPISISEKIIDQKIIFEIFTTYKIDLLPVLDSKKNISNIIIKEEIFQNSFDFKNDTSVVIMAGGRGQRLMPLTSKIPKPLLLINGESMLVRLIDKFINQKFSNFFISVNYKKNLIKKEISKIYKSQNLLKIKFIDERKPLGTIGSLSLIDAKLLSNPFIVTNSDTLINHDYKEFINFHLVNDNDLTIISSKKKFLMPYGNIEYENARVVNIQEKPLYHLNLNVGFYIVSKKCLNSLKKNKQYDATSLINDLIKKKYKISYFNINFDHWSEIGRKKEFDEYNQLSL